MANTLFYNTVGGILIERVERDSEFNMISKHIHNEYEIYYLFQGERYYFIENQIYPVKKGSLVLIDRNQIHKTVGTNHMYHDRLLILISKEELKYIFQFFDQVDIEGFFSKSFGIIELNEEGQKYVENILSHIMIEIKKQSICYEALVKSKLAELLIYAVRCRNGEHGNVEPITVYSDKYKKINEIAEYITINYQKDISLANISDDFYISKYYLSKIYKEITGFTVNEYINIIRIKKSQELLENSEHSITKIAELVGYDSITYFEKVFKKYMEVSPLKYRKRYTIPNKRSKK